MPDDRAESQDKEPDKQDQLDSYLWLGFPSVFLIWLGYGLLQGSLLPSDTSFDRLNALFSGLAFWGVIWAILLQKRELSFQRRELELTRQEVCGQKEELAMQSLTMRQQRFESTYFSLLNLYGDNINSSRIEAHVGGPPLIGRECFTYLVTQLKKQYTNLTELNDHWENRALCKKMFREFSETYRPLLGHYIRTMTAIIKFIDASDISDKQSYCDFIRAQLSSHELLLLFYGCASDVFNKDLQSLVQKYDLLKSMARADLFDPMHEDLWNRRRSPGPS